MSLFTSANTTTLSSRTPYSPVSLPHGQLQLQIRGSSRMRPVGFTLQAYRLALKDIFDSRVRDWMDDTQWVSSISTITAHRQFAEIVNMGEIAIPFVLERLASGELNIHWFPLLKDLAHGTDPVPPEYRGRVRQMANEWLAWGRTNHFID
jgi:hypothetical protein